MRSSWSAYARRIQRLPCRLLGLLLAPAARHLTVATRLPFAPVVEPERRDDQLIGTRMKLERKTADVAAIDFAGPRAVFERVVMNDCPAGWAAPRHARQYARFVEVDNRLSVTSGNRPRRPLLHGHDHMTTCETWLLDAPLVTSTSQCS